MKKEIVIVGGGFAGWITSLYLNKILDDSINITLIESEEIGILGVGEGTTPNIVSMLYFLDINFYDFIKNTNATHKLGISFENWSGDDSKYYHPFNERHNRLNWALSNGKKIHSEYLGYIFNNKLKLNDCIFTNSLLEDNKSPITKVPINNDYNASNYSFHFDAHLVAKYFKNIAESRGIKRIENVVDGFTKNEKDEISSVNLKNGQKIKSDFVFDCSGFARLIIGNEYKTNWISYKDKLTVNSAIPFNIPQSIEHINPYTKAVAMKYGWMWQIPLQNRWGCGYVFDDNYINSDEAKKEVEDLLGHSIENNRTIKFKAGRHEKVWVKNCISIGVSSTFTEPLEATSIFMQVNQLRALKNTDILNYINYISDESVAYNEYVGKLNDDVSDFLQFHYFTKRNDTEFWKTYYDRTKKSINLSSKLEKWKNIIPNTFHLYDTPVSLEGWILVGTGTGFFEKSKFIKKYKSSAIKENIEKHHIQNLKYINKIKKDCFYEIELLKQ